MANFGEETFVIKDKAPVFPVQKFDMGTATVQKHKYLTAGRLPVHHRNDQATKTVETLAHVAIPVVEIEPVRGTQ